MIVLHEPRPAEHGFTSTKGSAEHGFTLVEVMIALMIFGMIAAAGVALLSFSVRAQAVTANRLDDIAALDRTMSAMSADLAQALDRPTRDESGAVRPAFVGESGSETAPMLRLVRGGWENLDSAPRPAAQKVEYQVVNGALERIAYPQLDGAPPLPPAVLLTRVMRVRLRYRVQGAWNDRWDGAGGVALPQAMDLAITRDDGKVFHQLFLVGAGYVPSAVGGTNAGT